MQISEEIFIEKYIYYTIQMKESMSKGNYRKNNMYALKFYKLNKKCKNEKFYIKALKQLINNSDFEISSNAAVDSLRHNCNIDEAVKKLKEISSRKDTGIASLGSSIALENWLKNGKLE